MAGYRRVDRTPEGFPLASWWLASRDEFAERLQAEQEPMRRSKHGQINGEQVSGRPALSRSDNGVAE
jgi:hypothetical protein